MLVFCMRLKNSFYYSILLNVFDIGFYAYFYSTEKKNPKPFRVTTKLYFQPKNY